MHRQNKRAVRAVATNAEHRVLPITKTSKQPIMKPKLRRQSKGLHMQIALYKTFRHRRLSRYGRCSVCGLINRRFYLLRLTKSRARNGSGMDAELRAIGSAPETQGSDSNVAANPRTENSTVSPSSGTKATNICHKQACYMTWAIAILVRHPSPYRKPSHLPQPVRLP